MGSLPVLQVSPCVGSGFCCKTARCVLGAKVHGPGRDCPSLVWRDGRYWCGEVEKAKGIEKESLKQDLYIGFGCCMSLFNDLREERFKSMTQEQRQNYLDEKVSINKLVKIGRK